MTTRYAFGLIYDRWQLSCMPENQEKYTDEWGVYCVFSREALAAEMGVSLPTLRNAVKILIKRELIHSRLAYAGGYWRYYMPSEVVQYLEGYPDSKG